MLNDTYNSVYNCLCRSASFDDAPRAVLGDEYSGIDGQLSYVRKREVEECVMRIGEVPLHLANVLDVGCGTGGFTLHFAGFAKWAAGVDTSETAIAVAQDRAKRIDVSNAAFQTASFDHLPFENESFTTVTALDSIQHARPFHDAAVELSRIMTVGGTLVFTNWLWRAPLETLVLVDPLYTSLIQAGLRIVSVTDTDPGLIDQIKIYIALAERKAEIEREIGPELLQMFMADARHIAEKRKDIQRALTVAVKEQ
ncbi:class I SAM-dependent methyltransferase [Paraburkholderia sp. 22B1P]|uniref:class I SAM-dependent methyltransferase n=1 Tax=Paraburkholderia sp. 22B1P TaxID=3080498 RepID=UPI003084939B|nr:class I SAM-dependent methyltransferase [Paraburkholderia sp. 22B1P]